MINFKGHRIKRCHPALCSLVSGLSAQLPKFEGNDGGARHDSRSFEHLPMGSEVHAAVGDILSQRQQAPAGTS